MSQRRSRLSFHAINVGVEVLETRMVPSASAGHMPAHAAAVVAAAHGAPNLPAAASGVSKTHLTGTLISSDPLVKATGTVAFESQTHKAKTSAAFHVHVNGLAANTTFEVTVSTVTGGVTGAVIVGKITTNAAGSGELELSSRSKAHPLPDAFPPISDSTIVRVGANVVGANLSAKLSAPAPDDHAKTKLQASFSDSTLQGEAEYESKTERGVIVRMLKVGVKAPPGATLEVKIDGTSVGSIHVDASGKGSLVLSSQPVTGQSLLFPVGFDLHEGSSIKLGAATGTFAKSR